jgi:RimJ/RimL family protein N-acetyltransferase
MHMSDLVIRPLVPGEIDLFESLTDPGVVGYAAFGSTYRDLAAAGQHRPEWSWVALRDGRVVARAAWWGTPTDTEPYCLEWLDFDDPQAAAELLRTVPIRTDYLLAVPPRWREQPLVRAEAERRVEVAQEAGMRPFVQRYWYRWTPDDGLPQRPGRLDYRPEPDDDVILDVLRRMIPGSLDAHDRRGVAAHGAEATAKEGLETLRWFPSPREWWRLAYTPDGDLVGLTVPARNLSDPVIGLIGVVTEQRGHGYGYDLLVEATHLLVEHGADRIVAATDVTNTPMAAAFARAGYPVFKERIYLDWPTAAGEDGG